MHLYPSRLWPHSGQNFAVIPHFPQEGQSQLFISVFLLPQFGQKFDVIFIVPQEQFQVDCVGLFVPQFGQKFDFKPFESSNSTFYDEDIAFGLVFGNRLTDYVKIELESAYLGTSFQKNSNEFNYDIWSNMLNVYLFKEYGGAVAPYFGLGIGASAIWSAAYGAGDFRMDMSWQALVGINFALNQRIDLNLGLKYQDYGYTEHKNNAGNYAKTSIYGLQLYLGAAYKFSL